MQIRNIDRNDLFGQALLDYLNGQYEDELTTHLTFDENNLLPLPYMFRDFDQMPALEQKALDLCRGKILDVGCGAGSHSLYLQDKGFDLTALDISAGAVEVCRKRGVKNIIHSDFLDYSGIKFDTILLLMHGIGMAGTLDRLDVFLSHAMSLLVEGGQVLLDSSDIIYMFDQDEDGGYWVPGEVSYYGEVMFITEYQGYKSKAFPWLYLDFEMLKKSAATHKLSCDLVSSGPHYDYLARLTKKS